MSDKTSERGEPDEIWMQIHGDANPADYPDGPLPDLRGDDVTWCWEPIFEHDVKYVRADIVAALEAENARLREDAGRLQEVLSRIPTGELNAWLEADMERFDRAPTLDEFRAAIDAARGEVG